MTSIIKNKILTVALVVNMLLASAVFVGNYFYLTEGGLLLKGLCFDGDNKPYNSVYTR